MKTYFLTSIFAVIVVLSVIYKVQDHDDSGKTKVGVSEYAHKNNQINDLKSKNNKVLEDARYQKVDSATELKKSRKNKLTAADLDVRLVQVFNQSVDYMKQPTLENIRFVYNDLSSRKLTTLIAKIEKLLEIKKYVDRYNKGELSVQESLFFSSLTHRLSAARLVRLQRKVAKLGEGESEGT